MDFMTQEYVKQEAEKGKLPALKCSLKHHEQGRDAKRWELIVAIGDRKFGVRGDFCACCERNAPDVICGKDTVCPLKEKKESCCGGKWNTLCEAFDYFEEDYSNKYFKALQEAEAELCKYIEGKIAEEEAEAKKDEVTYSIGDRLKDSRGRKHLLCTAHRKEFLANLGDGAWFNAGMNTESCTQITPDEFKTICGTGTFTRYWDDRKKEYTDGRDDKKECKCKPDLKAVDKPELKEGDFGHWNDSNDGVVIVVNDSGGEKRWYSPDEGQLRKLTANSNSNFVKAGNLKEVFDDLAAIGEGPEVTYFEMTNPGTTRMMRVRRHKSPKKTVVDIRFTDADGHLLYFDFTREQLHDFILNLRRMEATLKTK